MHARAAGTPESRPEQNTRSKGRALAVAALVVICLAGFGLRAYRLGAEALSEDELNKVRAVAEYRERGLTPANGEHPFLMKALLAVSIVAADRWNSTSAAGSNPSLRVSTETATRLPAALLGALTSLLIYLVAAHMFGAEVGLVAAALWALDPAAVGFNRIAKEDSFLVFFFLLANVFWLKGRDAAEAGAERPEPYYWATAAAFGAMLASKYVPHFIAISGAYYYVFQGIRATRWRMGKRKWLVFFAVMGAAFVVCNPTILLPGTWREMSTFAGERRIGHDAYEFMGRLYRNQMSLWLHGSPWYFYYVFIAVKLPLATVAGLVAGLPLLFTRHFSDRRYFLLFWFFFWFFPFTFMGGKFTRYFTFALPAVLMASAVGIDWAARSLAGFFKRRGSSAQRFARAGLALLALAPAAYASLSAAPHYRLYTNALGGGRERAGAYFPHDEFYDSGTREAAAAVAGLARAGAVVATETPELFIYYARHAGRADLRAVSLSDREAVRALTEGDIIVLARGRRYFSNDAVTRRLSSDFAAAAVVRLGETESERVYVLDGAASAAVREALGR